MTTTDFHPSLGEARVALAGEYDMANADSIRSELLHFGSAEVIADLGEVTFMDSSALHELLDVQRTLAERGGSLRLTAVQPSLTRLFDVTGTAELFGLKGAV